MTSPPAVPDEIARTITRVLLADDHEPYRRQLREFLDEVSHIHVVAEAGDGRAAVRLAGELAPDAVLMDVSMPELNGIEATRQITGASPAVKVLAISLHCDRQFVDGMLAAGASGYLLKENAILQLVAALRVVMDGGTYLCDGLALARR